MPKSVPKRIQTCFRVIFSKKFNAQCSMEGRVFENFQKKNQKSFKIPKMPKIVPESIQTCFERVLGQIFRKFFCSVFRGGSSFRKISNFFFKIPKMPKSVPKSNQTCFERVLGQIFRNFFCSVFRGGSSFRKISKFFFSKFQKCPKSFPKVSKRVLDVFGANFRKIFAQFSMECLVFKSFQKKYFQNSKNAQKCSQKNPNVF